MEGRNSHDDVIVRLMTEPRNREILALLQNAEQSIHVEELAEQLVERNETILEASEYEDEYERVLIALHHDHLPKLSEVGLIEYDHHENTITYHGKTTVDAEWLNCEQVDELLGHFQNKNKADEDAIGVLKGREPILEHGRWLADEADEELFCMYVSTELLEEECVRRGKKAIERGVDIFVGSKNPDVRELTRKHLPEATLWEPQLDWLNTPSDSQIFGQLVFADREKLMLAFLDESPSGESPSEKALVGEGADNPLVVFVRQLLGPRLDHLDYQSTDFQERLESEP